MLCHGETTIVQKWTTKDDLRCATLCPMCPGRDVPCGQHNNLVKNMSVIVLKMWLLHNNVGGFFVLFCFYLNHLKAKAANTHYLTILS